MKSETTKMICDLPGSELLGMVRAGFIMQGTNLSKWCADNGVCRAWATDALLGKRNGPKAKSLRATLKTESTVQNGR